MSGSISDRAALQVLQSLGAVETEGELQRLNLLQCQLIVRESA
ncbi:hypothetical protein OH686_16925 [Pseudomonas sp. SO81]|nr:hypothetical protein OH686_16925 [Pseudomonas sp. SO81]